MAGFGAAPLARSASSPAALTAGPAASAAASGGVVPFAAVESGPDAAFPAGWPA
jgi:hypothetical protein